MEGNMYFDINEYIFIDQEEKHETTNSTAPNHMTSPSQSTLINNKISNTKENTKEIEDETNMVISKLKDKYSTDLIFQTLIAKLLGGTNGGRVKAKLTKILTSILEKSNVDYRSLRKLTFEGIPDDYPGYRSITWKMMLNYLPNSVKDWQEYVIERRKDYETIKSDFLDEKGSYPSVDSYLLSEITKDIKRTRCHMHFFPSTSKVNPNETNSDILTRILFIFAKIHPDVSYVQGMNELVAVIYYCFSLDPNPFFSLNLEADVFYCFENLMLEIKEIFLRDKDESESGIHNRLKNISFLLESYDEELFDHFQEEKIELHYFMFRWYTLLFTQDFNMPDTMRLWDSILTHYDKLEFLSYLCLALVVINKQLLIKKDFSNIMYVMQQLDLLDINIETLISSASEIKQKLSTLLKYLSNTLS